jgi:hypothetical protein
MSEKHAFPGKTSNCIIGMKIVGLNYNENETELSTFRATWTPAYGIDFNTRIDNLAATFMGVNTRDALFTATKTLNSLTGPAKHNLALLKTYIEVDFKSNPNRLAQILTALGYPTRKSVSAMTQSELVTALTSYKRGFTPELLVELTAKGMLPTIPNQILAAVAPILEAHSVQESLKGITKAETAEMIKAINLLYEEVIDLCKVVAKHYAGNSAKKDMFTFSTIMRNLGDTRASKDKDTSTDTTTTK